MDRSLLSVVPDAPRIAEQGFPVSFDWKFLPPKFFASSMKGAVSEFNLNSIVGAPNGMKSSVSAFEIISRSNSNANLGDTFEEEEDPLETEEETDESFENVVVEKVERPKTYK